MKTNNYDAIAGSYDFLSRLVFSRAQVNAQVDLLSYIPSHASVLIVGGGTGWILEEIAKIHTSGLKIVYVEISSKMLDRAKKRRCGSNQVEFVHSNIEDYRATQMFDVIHTAFLFDNFGQSRAGWVFHLLFKHLRPSGLWLYTDFKIEPGKGSGWKKAMLDLMYSFFGTIAHVEARKMPAMERIFESNGCVIIGYQQYYKGFIESIIFQKSQKLPTFMENLES
jgi:ubiquinone/menaquinone biosynthesis C-methylase UbiE